MALFSRAGQPGDCVVYEEDVFRPGELIKRKDIQYAHALCLIIGEDNDNYSVYNLTLKDTRLVAKVVIEGLYEKV